MSKFHKTLMRIKSKIGYFGKEFQIAASEERRAWIMSSGTN